MNIKLLVATHKSYWMPTEKMYQPLQVGAAGKETIPGCIRDDEGENISAKNPNYCELTGLYWAFKNLSKDVEYVGLCHYRRHFKGKGKHEIGQEALERLLEKQDLILAKPRNYYIETNYSQYVHAHHAIDLDTTRNIIETKYPEYLPAYDRSMKSTKGHRFNMFIMKREYFDAYCEWMFDILFQLEKELDISSYNAYDRRVFGFVSERLLDPWLMTKGYSYVEIPVWNLESQHWGKKIIKFIGRKMGLVKKAND